MTIFEQLHPRQDFKSPQEIVVLERRLDQLIKDGSIRELPPYAAIMHAHGHTLTNFCHRP